MRRICTLIIAAAFLTEGAAQNGVYPLTSVPEAVKKGANVIVHYDHTIVDVESVDKVSVNVKKAYTVLNEEGSAELVFRQYTSKSTQLEDVDVRAYDNTGKSIAKYRKKDMQSFSYGDGLVDDGFITAVGIDTRAYPVTIELQYTLKMRGTLALPAFYCAAAKEGIVAASHTVKVAPGLNLRYLPVKTDIKPVVGEESGKKTFAWSVMNIAPANYETGGLDYSAQIPHVKIATDQFSHLGYPGSYESWNTFGDWIAKLAQGRDELTPARQQFFKTLVKDAPDDREKARRIYQYMQDNFRYVSIQLGIGGFQPFPADFTDEKKYGDCKALSNYMKAALKAVGVRSHLAAINAAYNDEGVNPSFPVNDFNHMILCIPGKSDSIWLECTSQTAEFGELGTFTENRNALLITENGGRLVATPASRPGANRMNSRTTIKFEPDGYMLTSTVFKTTGAFGEEVGSVMKDKRDDQKRWLVYRLGYKEPEDFELKEEGEAVALTMLIRKGHEFNAGSKYFFAPRIHKIWNSKLPDAAERRQDFFFHHPFELRDTTVFEIKGFFDTDALPAEKKLQNRYASYEAKSWADAAEGRVYTATTLILQKHRIPASEYAAVKKFFEEVIADDSQRLVMKKREGDGWTKPADKKTF